MCAACGRVVKTDRPMGGRRAQKPGQTLSKVLVGGGLQVARRGGWKKGAKNTGGGGGGTRGEQKLKKLRAERVHTHKSARRSRSCRWLRPRRLGPTRSAPRASAVATRPPTRLPHSHTHTPLARKLFQNFCQSSLPFLH